MLINQISYTDMIIFVLMSFITISIHIFNRNTYKNLKQLDLDIDKIIKGSKKFNFTLKKIDEEIITLKNDLLCISPIKAFMDISKSVDEKLIKLIDITEFTDLKEYLIQKRDVLLDEINILLQKIFENNERYILESDYFTAFKLRLSSRLSIILEKSNNYAFYDINKSITHHIEKLEDDLYKTLKYGNGSKIEIFKRIAKNFVNIQLEKTFKEYYKLIKSTKNKKRDIDPITYIKSLIEKNEFELCFYELKSILGTKSQNDLILIKSRYNRTIRNINLNKINKEEADIELVKIANALTFLLEE